MRNKNTKTIDVSILIVHTFEGPLLRETIKSILRTAPALHYEIIVIDNNPAHGFGQVIEREFPQVRHLPQERNMGFGAAMNKGIEASRGEFVLIFNPDIVVLPESLERLYAFMQENSDVGMCGPQLRNPDGTLQYSCYRFPHLFLPAYRRTVLGKFAFARRAVESYLMVHEDHDTVLEPDSLIGAALFTRKSVLNEVGYFDERFFMYYEDNDLCRRFWDAGHRVVYYPRAQMVHYHRRASADGGLLQQLFNRFAWIQISSALKFFLKYRTARHTREQNDRQGK